MSRAEHPPHEPSNSYSHSSRRHTDQKDRGRRPADRRRRLSAGCIFLVVTIVMSVTASGLVLLALTTDHWEYTEFDRAAVDRVATNDTEVQWLMNGRVAKLSTSASTSTSGNKLALPATTGQPANATGRTVLLKRPKRAIRIVYLVPKHGGVWRICTHLNQGERTELAQMGYDHAWCQRYLSPEFRTEGSNDWMTRMQNLSISCAIVGLILLVTAALVGMFGTVKREISAVLVTAVMYILSAAFCIFTLSIMQFKRTASKNCGLTDPTVPFKYRQTEVIATGWSLAVGWVGVTFCLVTALLWYLLSKILRYGPITLTS